MFKEKKIERELDNIPDKNLNTALNAQLDSFELFKFTLLSLLQKIANT